MLFMQSLGAGGREGKQSVLYMGHSKIENTIIIIFRTATASFNLVVVIRPDVVGHDLVEPIL